MAEHPRAALVRKGYEAFTRGDLDSLRGLLAGDCTYHFPGSHAPAGDYKGQDAILDVFRGSSKAHRAGRRDRRGQGHRPRRVLRRPGRPRRLLVVIHWPSLRRRGQSGVSAVTIHARERWRLPWLNTRTPSSSARATRPSYGATWMPCVG
ncbi:nuclear transport factor 2 family protein [Streptomyces regalis]|uniref:nuclear transport factor 2 family protein n=1 Tax=Streptomyces regalis TaxID=68262 RepID=UPI003CC5F4CB